MSGGNLSPDELLAASRKQPHLEDTLAGLIVQMDNASILTIPERTPNGGNNMREFALATHSSTDSCMEAPDQHHMDAATPHTSLFHTTANPF